MTDQIQKISEARSETLIVEVGVSNDSYQRLFVRNNLNSKTWSPWEMSSQKLHDYLINGIDNKITRISELGPLYLDILK